MWSDVETSTDFLNFRVLARLAAQMIVEANGKALSIGVSGGWGAGKSSMLRLIEEEIGKIEGPNLVVLDFNAWLYQGHDDAKAALMEEISRLLMERAKADKTLLEKAQEFASRVNYFRLLRLGVETAVTVHTGIPVSALTTGLERFYAHVSSGTITADDVANAKEAIQEGKDQAKGILRPKEAPPTPPQTIHALRAQFKELLEKLNITLVVFVDDLDRCLPPTVIGTLEAIRLFLFLDRTAFVIAADDKMIKEAVRFHFRDARLDDDIVTSYFDKLVQVPLRVPSLGINEARAYLMLLFVDNGGLDQTRKESVRAAVNRRLAESWKGESVNAGFVLRAIGDCPLSLRAEITIADRLAKQMVSSRHIGGNPRLMKRFLNTLSIRRSLAKVQGIQVDDALLAKVLLFERCAAPASFEFLVKAVNAAADGKAAAVAKAEIAIRGGEDITEQEYKDWAADKDFVSEWLKLDPALTDVDLRGALHVGRENRAYVSIEDRVSAAAREIAGELLAARIDVAPVLKKRFTDLPREERQYVVDKLVERASTETKWGTPEILWGLAGVAEVDEESADRIVAFFAGVQSATFTGPFIPRVGSSPWGKKLLAELGGRTDLPDRVKTVLRARKKGGV
jgi:predicted KAP-like P-loop ATPase